jgi:hypothetical protein
LSQIQAENVFEKLPRSLGGFHISSTIPNLTFARFHSKETQELVSISLARILRLAANKQARACDEKINQSGSASFSLSSHRGFIPA